MCDVVGRSWYIMVSWLITLVDTIKAGCGATSDWVKQKLDQPCRRLGVDKLDLAGAEVQADCICIVYLCVHVCVIEGGGAGSTTGLESAPGFKV